MLPGANGANRKPVLLLRFRQGASQPLFQQAYAFTLAAWQIPAFRQMSATGTPSLPCLRMNAFCASENCDAFIVFSAPPSQGKLQRKTPTPNGPVFGERIIMAAFDQSRPITRLTLTGDNLFRLRR